MTCFFFRLLLHFISEIHRICGGGSMSGPCFSRQHKRTAGKRASHAVGHHAELRYLVLFTKQDYCLKVCFFNVASFTILLSTCLLLLSHIQTCGDAHPLSILMKIKYCVKLQLTTKKSKQFFVLLRLICCLTLI